MALARNRAMCVVFVKVTANETVFANSPNKPKQQSNVHSGDGRAEPEVAVLHVLQVMGRL